MDFTTAILTHPIHALLFGVLLVKLVRDVLFGPDRPVEKRADAPADRRAA